MYCANSLISANSADSSSEFLTERILLLLKELKSNCTARANSADLVIWLQTDLKLLFALHVDLKLCTLN